MVKHLLFALRYYTLFMLGGACLVVYAIYGLCQNPADGSGLFSSVVSLYGDLIYCIGFIIGLVMIIYSWKNSIPASQQVRRDR